MRIDPAGGAVAEIQGLYGPFSFPEKLLQKIWFRGTFDRGKAVTTAGERVQVLHPGKWNLLGGPDFKGAKLRFGNAPVCVGDVELHLHAEGWAEHGHARDRAYDGVVLHVVLFPPERGHVTLGVEGREIPVLVLLPVLLHDLEEFAAEDVVENLANRPLSEVQQRLGALGPAELLNLLRHHAERRWQQKLHFARIRQQRLGWESACQHVALEILGYRFNRAPMLRIASAYSLEAWARGEVEPDTAYRAEAEAWSLQGVRPANQPRIRLRQYGAWTSASPDWPRRLTEWKATLPSVPAGQGTRWVRRKHEFTRVREQVQLAICGGAVGGTRFDNLVCDGFLPLLDADALAGLGEIWWHWYPGDLPPVLAQALRGLGMTGIGGQPAAHGLGQGLLGWLIEREREDSVGSGRGA